MKRVLFLDTGPLGMLTHPRGSERTLACAHWFEAQLQAGVEFVLPDITDYELRRELERIHKQRSLLRLDALRSTLPVMALSSQVMLHAAKLWAWVRQQGQVTAADKALDGDVILAAQAAVYAASEGCEVLVITENVGHLSWLTRACKWDEVPPISAAPG